MTSAQRTLRDPAVIEGTGAFTARNIRLEIHPAPINHGVNFELEIDGNTFNIPVSIDNIVEKDNRTVLACPEHPDKRVNFVEHILGTLHGLEIDNAVIRLDAEEVPLIDGSAETFIRAIEKSGIVEQDAERDEITVERPLFIDNNGLLIVLPSENLKISYYLDHPEDIIGKRLAHIDVTADNFRRRIGPARSFIKEEWIEGILASGEVTNMDERQVLIVRKDSVSQPLRFADEYNYHKMLDILGDFFLAGKRIRAHIIGIRSGHTQNREMIRKIVGEFSD